METKSLKRENKIRSTKDGSVNKKTLDEKMLLHLTKYKNKCPHCNTKYSNEDLGSRISIDHITPLAKGGSHTFSNIDFMCYSCNSSKGNKTLDEWILRNHESQRNKQKKSRASV
jgi:5-methylcytosine-specific restriction endonuclease McrA